MNRTKNEKQRIMSNYFAHTNTKLSETNEKKITEEN